MIADLLRLASLPFSLSLVLSVNAQAADHGAAKIETPMQVGGAHARAASALSPSGPHRDLTRVEFDEPGDGRVWVLGNGYKASFGPDGTRVFPRLGARSQAAHALALAPASLERGGEPIAFAKESHAARSGERVSLDRSAFVEHYEARASELEQSFEFARLSGRGDVVLRLSADTDLSAGETAAGWTFENELGGVRYGCATAVDARGVALPLETRVADGSIEIRVPGAFVDSAAFPLTIDPVISTFAIDASASDDFAPDVAYDPTFDRYMVCYEEVFSASDHDVYEELLDGSGAVLAGGYIDFTSNDWRHPRIANNAYAAQFMVVAQVGAAPLRSIWSRTASAAGGFGNQTAVASAFAGTDQVDPDIGGDPDLSAQSNYLVVWEFVDNSTGERDIVQMLMHDTGLPDSFAAICIDCSASARDFNPAISKSAGTGSVAHRWNVVWEFEFSSSDHDIYGAQLANAFQVAGPFVIDASGDDDRRPSVSSFADQTSAPGNYLVVFDRFFPTDHDIIGYAMNGASSVASASLSYLEGPTFYYQDQIAPSVDSDGCAFAVAYSEQYSTSTTDYDVYVSTFNVAGSGIDALETHQNLAFTSLPELDVKVTAAHGGPALRYMAAWTRQASGNSDIYGGLYDSAQLVSYCFAGQGFVIGCPCSNPGNGAGGCNNSVGTGGATLVAAGSASLSGDTLGFTQSGELPSSLSIFLQGNGDIPTGTTFGDGVRCAGGALKRLYVHGAAAGTVSAPIGADSPVSVRSAALGDAIAACSSRFYQVYYRDPNLTFCSAGFNIGNGVKALWLP
jgi:hypothetical protein